MTRYPIKSLFQPAAAALAQISHNPLRETEIIMAKSLGLTRGDLLVNPALTATLEERQTFYRLIKQRQTGRPLAYLLGEKEFYGNNFTITPAVLVPRPESELLVDIAKKRLKGTKRPRLLELGTGSGAIAVSLALVRPLAKITATDISAAALKIARTNAWRHQTKITFIKSDLLQNIKSFQFDLLIANLPYLPTASLAQTNKPDTIGLRFEPRLALDGGSDGLNIYRRLLRQLPAQSYPRFILLEIDPRQAESIKKISARNLPPHSLKFAKDLAGWNRVCVITIDRKK